jgi:hypothetical protein
MKKQNWYLGNCSVSILESLVENEGRKAGREITVEEYDKCNDLYECLIMFSYINVNNYK